MIKSKNVRILVHKMNVEKVREGKRTSWEVGESELVGGYTVENRHISTNIRLGKFLRKHNHICPIFSSGNLSMERIDADDEGKYESYEISTRITMRPVLYVELMEA